MLIAQEPPGEVVRGVHVPQNHGLEVFPPRGVWHATCLRAALGRRHGRDCSERHGAPPGAVSAALSRPAGSHEKKSAPWVSRPPKWPAAATSPPTARTATRA